MHKITFLGPFGATFSHDAYNVLAELYGAPKATEYCYYPASSNSEILKIITGHSGYGAIATETLADARIDENLGEFAGLLDATQASIPFCIAGAIQLELHFCLMARHDISLDSISRVVGHNKAYGVCKENIARLGAAFVRVDSNGEAARLVAESEEYRLSAALGPRSAAQKYGLSILNDTFEDARAVTTFFLLAPSSHEIATTEKNRLLVAFKSPHKPGGLAYSLLPFAEEGLNLTHLYSSHSSNLTYNFVIEVEVGAHEIRAVDRAMEKFRKHVDKHLSFGPFPVLSR